MPSTAQRNITPAYYWDERTQRYHSATSGQIVSYAQVRTAMDNFIESGQTRLQGLTLGLQDGRLSLAEWEARFATTLKDMAIASAVLARGGWGQMRAGDWGRVGAEVRRQYEYLDHFAREIASGAQALDGRLNVRADLYGQAVRGIYEEVRRAGMSEAGMTEERRMLGIAENCPDCLDYAAQGWQPIGTLPRIGESVCRTNCHCAFQYRGGIIPNEPTPD